MASWQARQKDPLLDQGTQAMLERRGRELIGVGLALLALLFAVMLGSYSPEDPGWMVSTQEPARNMLGRFGASVSSTLVILIGRGAWALPVIFAAWGARFILHHGAERVLGRAIFAVIAVAVAAAFASTLSVPQGWTHSFGLGGLFGDTVAGALLGVAGQSGFGLTLISFGTFIGLLAIMTYVTGFDRNELRSLANRLRYGSAMGFNSVLGSAAKGAASAANGARSGMRAGAKAMAERRQNAADFQRQEQLPLHGGASYRPEDQPLIEDHYDYPESYEPAPLAAPARKVVRRAPLMAEPPLMAAPDYSAHGYQTPQMQASDYDDYSQYSEPQFDPRPAPLSAQQGYSAPVNLRAEPRYFEPSQPLAPEPVKEKQGFFSRILRGPEPEQVPLPEIVEPMLTAAASEVEAPNADRIKARISDVVRTRASGGKSARATAGMTPLQAAIAARRPEPPMVRPRGPAPLIADTRPLSTPPIMARPVQPQPEQEYQAYASEYPDYPDAYAGYEPDLEPVPYEETFAPAPQAAPQREPLRSPPPPVRYTGDLDDFDDGPVNLFADDEDDWAPRKPIIAAPVVAPAVVAAPRVMAPQRVKPQPYEPAYEEEEEEACLPTPPAPRVAPPPERRAVVQPQVKKAIQPSLRAKAEAQPPLRFEAPQGPEYELPPLALLAAPSGDSGHQLSDEALEENARMLESVLDDYGVKGEIVSVRPGPVVTMYELEPAPGLKASRVIGLADDIARSMSALSARVSTVPGRTVIGIELPNSFREKVFLREILAAREFGDGQQRLPLALGKDIGGDPVVANLAKMPHLLIAGTTGSGKSVAINTMILSLLYKLTPEECRMIMIDPKMLELSVYDGIPHLLSPVVTDPKKAVVALKWVVGEMEERYRKMSKMGVRNIDGYNGRVREALATGEMFKRTIQTGFDDETGDPVFETEEFAPQPFPYIVVIVDEMADLMMVAGKEIEACIQRLAQMARASGIHLIMATQRPSVDVITGTIKANFPTRISFQVTSKIDSRTILGEQGAEQLLGQGDMLYMGNGQRITRIHGPFVSDEEVEEIVGHLKSFGPPTYMSGVVDGPDEDKADDIDAVLGLGGGGDSEDSLYDQAVAIVARDRKCSTSYIQRKLGIGYNKAARLVEQMEDEGVVTSANHVGKREILIPEQ